jgi:hypothetical protein
VACRKFVTGHLFRERKGPLPNSLTNGVLHAQEFDEETPSMPALALRFVLFCALTAASSALIAIPYLTIH